MIKAQQPSLLGRTARIAQPFTNIVGRRVSSLRVRSSPESNGAVAVTTFDPPPPALEFYTDSETIKDVFAFAGPAPERVNGRVAMYAFAALAFTEIKTHTPVLEQFGNDWFAAIFFSLLITFASIVPKLASGVPLKDLHASATTENMTGKGWRQFLALFDTNVELWTGRVAMIGVLGLVVAEIFKGDSFF